MSIVVKKYFGLSNISRVVTKHGNWTNFNLIFIGLSDFKLINPRTYIINPKSDKPMNIRSRFIQPPSFAPTQIISRWSREPYSMEFPEL